MKVSQSIEISCVRHIQFLTQFVFTFQTQAANFVFARRDKKIRVNQNIIDEIGVNKRDQFFQSGLTNVFQFEFQKFFL
jgi:hypothetical protein